MSARIFRSLGIILLILVPFLPITAAIFPDQINEVSFSAYLLTCLTINVLALMLIYFLSSNNTIAGWLLFFIGMVVLYPLHLGAPRVDATLLSLAYIEKFRYALLVIASLLLIITGIISAYPPQNSNIRKLTLACLIPFIILTMWDNLSSFYLSTALREWLGNNSADTFALNYDWHIAWRAAARIALYIFTFLLAVLFSKKQLIHKWQLMLLSIFCVLGIAFCMYFLIVDPAFYFPFMIPAVALAPAYWLGIILLTKKPVQF